MVEAKVMVALEASGEWDGMEVKVVMKRQIVIYSLFKKGCRTKFFFR